MIKAELFEQLEGLSPDELTEVADRIEALRGGNLSAAERTLLESRLAMYRSNPEGVVDLDEAVSEILGRRL